MKKILRRTILWIFVLLVIPLFVPQTVYNPVEGCGSESYNHKTFWWPWGDHHHRGVDIFAKTGTPIHSAVYGVVVAAKESLGAGGNCLLIASTQGRFYYYAHMSKINTHVGAFVGPNDVIGFVGDTGNAKGKAPHCHFSIPSVIPQFNHLPDNGESLFDNDNLQKIFFVNPVDVIDNSRKTVK